MSNEIELAWCAGFFDGEGYIGYDRAGKYYRRLRLTITQKNKQPLNRFREAVGKEGISIYAPYNLNDNAFRLHTTSSNALRIFNLIKPYLCEIKLKQGEEAIKLYETDCQTAFENKFSLFEKSY